MILFACDLDGTLIHSHKSRRDDDVCIEHYDGREQSFIARPALERLKTLAAQIQFVPVTTRSLEQYRRIFWTPDFKPQFAVVANGAIFLDGNKIIHREDLSAYAPELNRLQKKFADNPDFNICRIVDESFLFLRPRDDLNPADFNFQTDLTVQRTGKKIYLFPPPLTKGNALRKLVKIFKPDKIIAAGDSEIDLPMLEVALMLSE